MALRRRRRGRRSHDSGELTSCGKNLRASVVEVALAQQLSRGTLSQGRVQALEPRPNDSWRVPFGQQSGDLVRHPEPAQILTPDTSRVSSAHCRTARVSLTPPK